MPSSFRVIHSRPDRPSSLLDAASNDGTRRFLRSVIDDESRSGSDRLMHRRLLAELDGQIASQVKWRFSMISCTSGAAIARHLRAKSYRPAVALELLWICLREAEFNDGVVGMSRPKLAAELGVEPRVISRLMGEFLRIGVVTRELVDDDGVRLTAPRYRVNPNVATNARRAVAKTLRAAAPPLSLVP